MRALEDVPDSWLWAEHRLPATLKERHIYSFYFEEFIFRRIPNVIDLIQYYRR